MPRLNFVIKGQTRTVEVNDLVIAGWTGRNLSVVEQHIAELQAIGIARPRTTPIFYRVGANLLTIEPEFDVTGTESSGEVEFVLASLADGLFVGVGSDHTDRKVEAYGVTVSKQMCQKPIAPSLWPIEEVGSHWDSLVLRSWVMSCGARRLYQEGPVAQMLAPYELINRYLGTDQPLPLGTFMFCGTLPLLDRISQSDRFVIEMEDPVRNRRLVHAYQVRCLAYAD